MLHKFILNHTKFLLARKSSIFIYLLMLGLVLCNFYYNINQYYGLDKMELYDPQQILFLNQIQPLLDGFMNYLPFLVVIPCALSYIDDEKSGELIFMKTRCGSLNYYIGKTISVFLVTFCVFTLPLLIEVLLNYITFPSEALRSPSGNGIYSVEYIQRYQGWLLPSVYSFNPYVYSLLFISVFGAVSAIFAVFVLAISTIKSIKYKIILFLPVYAVLTFVGLIPELFSTNLRTSYRSYFSLFGTYSHYYNGFYYFVFMLFIFIVSLSLIFRKIRKDTL